MLLERFPIENKKQGRLDLSLRKHSNRRKKINTDFIITISLKSAVLNLSELSELNKKHNVIHVARTGFHYI